MEHFRWNHLMKELQLKEAQFLMSLGKEADDSLRESILGKILPKEPRTRILLQILGNQLKWQASDEEEPTLLVPELAFRGIGSGGFRVHREIEGKHLQFVFQPNADNKEVYISVETQDGESLSAKLFVEGIPVETLPKLAERSMFDSPITIDASPELAIFEKGRELGRYHFMLQA